MINFSAQKIIKKAKQGDKESFIILIEENLKSMYKVSKGILMSEADVEDCIQSTIIIAFEKISYLKKDEYFKTWLLRILINECNRVYNLNKKVVSIDSLLEESSEEVYEDIDLKNAIKALPNEMREVIVLFYYEDISQKEIAEILKIPEGTVKSRLSRGKKILERYLSKGDVVNG